MTNNKSTYTRSGRKVTPIGGGQLTPEENKEADAILAADEAEHEVRVNFRWGAQQLNEVKAIARQMGVPYQTYMKQAIYRQCMQDAASLQLGGLLASPCTATRRFITTSQDPADIVATIGRAFSSSEHTIQGIQRTGIHRAGALSLGYLTPDAHISVFPTQPEFTFTMEKDVD